MQDPKTEALHRFIEFIRTEGLFRQALLTAGASLGSNCWQPKLAGNGTRERLERDQKIGRGGWKVEIANIYLR